VKATKKVFVILHSIACRALAVVLLFNCSFIVAQQAKIDSLATCLLQTLHDTDRLNTLNDIAWELRHTDPDQALLYVGQSLALAEELNARKELADGLNIAGAIEENKGNFDLAVDFYLRSVRVEKESDNRIGLASSYNNLGNVYYYQDNYDNAIEYYEKALKTFEELGKRVHMAGALSNIGIIYMKLGETALNAGDTGQSVIKYDSALEYYRRAIGMYNELGEKAGAANNLSNIGIIYYYMNMKDSTLVYFQKSLQVFMQLADKGRVAMSLNNIAELYAEQKNYLKAIEFSDSSLSVAHQIGDKHQIMVSNKTLAELYAEIEDFESAYRSYKQASVYKDSLFNEEKSKEIGKLEAKHEFEMEEMDRKRKEQEQARLQVVIKKRRDNLQYSVIVIIMVILALMLVGISRITISQRLAEGLIFFTFLLFFEFCLVLLDPYIDQYSSGAPAINLGFNALLAALIFPLHSFFESKLKRRIAK